MITTLLIFFYRWLWECPPLADNEKTAFVFWGIAFTIFELAWIGASIRESKE